MRTKPKDGEFEILDRMDEMQIRSGGTTPFWQIRDLVSLSYLGMIEIADLNSIQKLSESTDLTGFFLTLKGLLELISTSNF